MTVPAKSFSIGLNKDHEAPESAPDFGTLTIAEGVRDRGIAEKIPSRVIFADLPEVEASAALDAGHVAVT